MGSPISYETIVAAKSGDAEAMKKILRHYERYVIVHSMRALYDEYGNHYEVIDQDIRQRIEAKLIYQIIHRFDPTKMPAEESIT